jgi:threonylcarbamoyladenosine tRNA methylthiotransferase MtaB
VRLSSLDPREVNGRLIDLIAASDVVCPHLHICAQAGDDEILKQMRRNYDTRYYRDLLFKVRERLPDAALGSDIIVGFPGETDAHFERSLEYFAALPLTYFHVSPYSTRRGTAAALLPEPLPAQLKKARAQKMRELGREKKNAFCHSFIGRRVSVLVEGKRDKKIGYHRGFSRNYLPVAVRAGENRVNREMPITLDSFDGEWLRGTAIDDLGGSDGLVANS